ncbi:MAG TPA: J domain-containing protein [Acidimicrobiales bacterium]|nr:J domain-containing protein [Acidimicrobiales bacterium]
MPGAAETHDLYRLLGVPPDATDDEIKRAYRKKARELHPDARPDDPEAEAKFKEVSLAYEVLRDPERRARYDRYGPEGVFGQPAGGGPFNFETGLGDLFEAFFGSMGGGARGRRRGPVPGADAEVSLRLTFAEAAFGALKELSVRLPVVCDVCGGSGAEPGTGIAECPDCQGTGEIRRIRQSLLGQVVTAVACSRCQGLGETIPHPCEACRGERRRMQDRTFAVEVPAGVEDGSTLRLAERGPAGPRGGPNGSLFVHLSVAPDERFERAGDDLHTTVHISMAQAALGTEVSVPTLEEPRQVTVAPGTQGGHVVRLKGAGVPHLRGRGRGDLFVHLVVDTPRDLDARQEALLRQLAAERGEPVSPPAGGEGVFSRLRSAFS